MICFNASPNKLYFRRDRVMFFYRQKLYLQIVLLLTAKCAAAQEVWPNAEIAQMYRHAQEYTARADYSNAITTFRQALALAPGKALLYKELGNALYLSGKYREAEQTLTSVCATPDADAICYQLLAASEAAQGNSKEALSALKKGLIRFPQSGLLYHERGEILSRESKMEGALNAWLDGIANEPVYAPNYYEAAATYLSTDKAMWGLLYGEMFLDLKHDTTNDSMLKSKLFAGYKSMFDRFAIEEPQLGKTITQRPAKNFEEAVLRIYSQLTPVISDGIGTENLTMVRTRFLMDWFPTYGSKYPFSLFSYQDTLVKYGRFDIWNEWIFGKAESETEYKAWNTFHEGAITRTMDWQKTHPFHPSMPDSYNDRNMAGLFEKKKK